MNSGGEIKTELSKHFKKYLNQLFLFEIFTDFYPLHIEFSTTMTTKKFHE